MSRRPLDLSNRITEAIKSGGPADFPVYLKHLFHWKDNYELEALPNRMAVTRQDTGEILAIVSDRYTLVPHQRILDLVSQAVGSLDVGPVPCGVYVDRRGARMRALFKFPGLAQPVAGKDDICPCLKVQNTYDATSRITLHIGAFRFVCTNLAVGGGGAFAGGFMAVHAGEIQLDGVADQLTSYLADFDSIVQLYRYWQEKRLIADSLKELMAPLPKRPRTVIELEVSDLLKRKGASVYDAYNMSTFHATHRMRTSHGAFDLLKRVNGSFQGLFPLPSKN